MKKYKRNMDLVWEKVGNKMIGLNGEKGELYELNQTAEFIWKILEETKNKNEIFKEFKKKYNEIDFWSIESCLKKMEDLGVIVTV